MATSSSRLRSTSDPFVDPAPRKKDRPPPPPPKMPASSAKPDSKREPDIVEAVRDTVTIRNDQPARQKVSRAQTSAPPASSSRPSGRRSQSEDSSHIAEKPRSSGKARGKKGSQYADVIDRLDYTGPAMFHHDGPFDACAPSRNKQRSKAPMYAWGDEPAPRAYGDSAYPSADVYKVFSNDYPEKPKKKVDAIAEAWGIHEPEPFEEFFAGGGSGRADDTPASSIYNGRSSGVPGPSSSRRPKESRDDRDGARPRHAARRSLVPPPQPIFANEPVDSSEPLDSPPPSSPGFPKRSRSLMQRIRKMRDAPNVPVGATDYGRESTSLPSSPVEASINTSSAPYSSNAATSTSTTTAPAPPASRPTHKSTHSFLGRFGGGSKANQAGDKTDKSEPFVYIDASQKQLPVPPALAASASAPGENVNAESGDYRADAVSAPGGLGRKTSLIKKVGRAVRGAK